MADLQRIGFRITDNDVVDEVDVDDLGGFPEVTGLCELPNYGNWSVRPAAGLDPDEPR